MSRTIESQETDAFADELVSRALSNLPDGPLEQMDQLINWELFRRPFQPLKRLGLAPNNQISGDNVLRSRRRKANRLGQAFCQCAVTVRRTETWLSTKHRRILTRMEKQPEPSKRPPMKSSA